jgi:hypothetical protein
MNGSRIIKVTSPRHTYKDLPVYLALNDLEVPSNVVLQCAKTGRVIPAQVVSDAGQRFLCWNIESISAGESREYRLVLEGTGLESHSIVDVIDNGENRVDFLIGGNLFTSYHYGEDVIRPFLYPIVGPGGRKMTRNFPMVQGVPGETTDHKHHRSLYVAYGDVNSVDNWSEEEGCGRIVHRAFLEKYGGPVLGRIRVLNDWVDSKGGKLMEEVRTITVYNLPETGRIIDIVVAFHATEGDVKFGDTKEGGIVSVRVATSMDGDKGGTITNSYGGITEAETWGKPAHWCDYSGPVDGKVVGIAIFDTPSNFRYPTRWHVRDYGLFAANPFALSAYLNDPNVDGSYVVKSGELLTFAYRLYLHDGDVCTANVAEQYHGYINPPLIEIL